MALRTNTTRLAAVAGLLLLAGVAAAIIYLISSSGTTFDPDKFRAAAAKDDTSVMQTQAQAAIDQKALLGLSTKQLRATLGDPTKTYRKPPRMVWQVAGVDESGSPGTKLVVELNSKERAIDARLDAPPVD